MIGFVKKVVRNRLAGLGLVVLFGIILLAILTPLLPLAPPNAIDTPNRFVLPFSDNALLGTDHLGRDLLSRLLWGTQLSLAVGLAAAFIAGFFGALLGIVAGYMGGRTDSLIMRSVDILMAFPYILLALAIVAALGPGLMNALIAVAVVNIPFFARNVRGVAVTLAQADFIQSARLSGRSDISILVFELLPNVASVIIIAFSTTVGWMILETAGLSFLGLGSQPPQADLGSMLGEGRAALITNPHTSIIPGIMIFLIVMGINLLGDGIRDALDPRLAKGQLEKPSPLTRVGDGLIQSPPIVSTASNAVMDVNHLSTNFEVGEGVNKAVRDVSFSISSGECLGLVGESGSGKSVTALSLTRLVASPPGVVVSGSVRISDQELISLPYEGIRAIRGRRVAYIFQDPLTSLHPLHRIGHQLTEAMSTHSRGADSVFVERAKNLLSEVRIPNPERVMDAYPHELSGGMRQRIGISMALANDPDLIIADEPTTALDVTVQAQILAILNDLRQQRGLSILFISHDLNVMAQICDRVAVMYAGEIVEMGRAPDILEHPKHPYTAALLACSPQIGQGRQSLQPIMGMPPTGHEPLNACAFANRCSRVQPVCQQQPVEIIDMDSQLVRCLFPVVES